MNPFQFAHSFDLEFRRITRGARPLEIPLFRSLRDTFHNLSQNFNIEEYHGGRHQVKFIGKGPWGRQNARCELCDLLIVTFRRRPNVQIRVTFLQAKSEKRIIPKPIGTPKFNANLEQWDLLSRRPIVAGYGNFNPPDNILSGALLPSVGTFCFFYRDSCKDYQICYSAADNLLPVDNRTAQKYSKVRLELPCNRRTIGTSVEMAAAGCNYHFGFGMANGEIGTPIETQWDGQTNGASRELRRWLRNIVATMIAEAQKEDRPTRIASELIDLLSIELKSEKIEESHTPTVIVIKTD